MADWKAAARDLGVLEAAESGRFVAALEGLVPALYGDDAGARERAGVARDGILDALREAARTATHPPRNRMKFGTSGWRGILVDDFTVRNVTVVTQALVDVLLDPASHGALGVVDVADLRRRGCVVAHDTRILGPEFAEAAARVLLAHDIAVIHIGMATTPEVSTAIAETRAAFSINFTPSHNPFSYQGYKFNPADGGPATQELTRPVAARANELFDAGTEARQLDDDAFEAARTDPARYRTEDPIELYRQSLARRLPWLDLGELGRAIAAADVALFVDNGFGATRGKYPRLLEGLAPGKLTAVNDGEDFLFGGKSREPSVENFRAIQELMKQSNAALTVGFMNDGDGDRFVGGGREAVLVMNLFGPMVVRWLTQRKGLDGDVTRSVMTSSMADAARERYLPDGRLHETAVGFQYLKSTIPESVNSWEESDGMSPKGWSRDKDGLLAALILTAMVLDTGKSPEALLAETQHELGHFFFERRKVSGAKQGEALTEALRGAFGYLRPGTDLLLGGRCFTVDRVVTLDGIKVVLSNGWWFGMRASGTEPVARPYVETFTRPGADPDEIAETEAWKDRLLAWLERQLRAAIA